MSTPPPGAIRAVVFDAYGTLFDVSAAARRARDELGERWEALAALWRSKQLEYAWLRSLMGRHADFWTVSGEALDFALDSLGFSPGGLRDRILDLYANLGPHADARRALAELRAAGLRLAVLSNGAPEMLASAADASGLSRLLDHLLSAEEVGIYKPAPAVYQLAVDRLGAPAGELLFVSSNAWDAHGAKVFGLRVAWCNRSGQPAERLPGAPDHVVRSLAELPALVIPARAR